MVTQKRNNTEYDNAMEQYNQQLQDYKNKMNWQNVLFSSQILQALKLVPEPNAKAKIDLLLPTSSDLNSYGVEYHQPGEEYIASAIGDKSSGAVRLDQTGESLLHVTNAQAGKDFARVTYTGLQNSMWAGHHISKIIATYSQLTDVYGIGNKDANGNPIGYIAISNDPYYGTFTYGLGGFAIDYQYYDENGNRINFGDQNDGAGAWFSIGSLNSSGPTGRVESVQLQSPGRLYQLAGSKVGVYSNVSMTNPIPDSTGKSGDYAYSPESTLPDDWDSTLGLNDPNAYIGATVAHVTGDHVKFSFFTQGNHNNMWAYPSTIVPVTPGPSRPVRKTSEAHYRYNQAYDLI